MMKSAAMLTRLKAKQRALATGLRLRMTPRPQTIMTVEKNQKKRASIGWFQTVGRRRDTNAGVVLAVGLISFSSRRVA